ncbi:EthD family reductase [Thermodesulfobacteriota bacterium]
MIRASVYYPSGEGKIDMDYYLNTHIPLVEKLMEPYGLVKVEVDKGIGGGKPGEAAPFVTIAQMVFNSMEEFQKGSEVHEGEFAADVKNFTDIKPFFQVSEIVK